MRSAPLLLPLLVIALAACRGPEEVTGVAERRVGAAPLALRGKLSAGDLPLPPGSTGGRAFDVNDNGVAVGAAFHPGGPLALRWTSMTEVTVLSPPPHGSTCAASRVNEKGTVAGGCSVEGAGHVVTWSPAGTPTDIGAGTSAVINNRGDVAFLRDGRIMLSDGKRPARELAVASGRFPRLVQMNNRGDVLLATNEAGQDAAILVLKSGELFRLSGPPGTSLRPAGINDVGQAAGWFRRAVSCSGGPSVSGCSGVWRWSAEEGYAELERWEFPPVDFGEVGAINNLGQISGGLKTFGSASRAIVWDWNGHRIAEYPIGLYPVAYGLNRDGLAVGAVTRLVSGPPIEEIRPRVF